MLLLARSHFEAMVAHCLDGLPLEACGLLAGLPVAPVSAAPAPTAGAEAAGAEAAGAEAAGAEAAGASTAEGAVLVVQVYPTANAARSARLYTVEPLDLLKADRAAEAAGLSLVGVWHSHTHTPAYPSPTDVAQAPDPSWHYVLVSLSAPDPVLRSYRIVGGDVREEQVRFT